MILFQQTIIASANNLHLFAAQQLIGTKCNTSEKLMIPILFFIISTGKFILRSVAYAKVYQGRCNQVGEGAGCKIHTSAVH
jgi:hypothetical protein